MSTPPIAIFAHDKKGDGGDSARHWLKARVASPPHKVLVGVPSPNSRKGATHSMQKASVYQNSLQAVAFPQHLSGYKNPHDPSHKNDKSAYISSYKGNFGPVDDKPVKFRDGMPIDARRVPGKPLMDWEPFNEGPSAL